MAKDWSEADRISDRIVEMMNEELKRPNYSATQMLAGLMLGMMAFIKTADGLPAPPEFVAVRASIMKCLQAMIAAGEEMDDA